MSRPDVRTRLAASIAAGKAFDRFIALLERTSEGQRQVLPVLTYHRIAGPGMDGHFDPTLVSASPESFERQVEFLASERRPVTLQEIIAVREGESELLPPRPVLVTFDDAYRDFAHTAWPILRRHGIPVTLFVATGYVDAERVYWWDHLYHAVHCSPHRELRTPFGHVALDGAAAREEAFRLFRRRLKTMRYPAAMDLCNSLLQLLDAPPPKRAVLSWQELRMLAADGVVIAPHSRTHPMLDQIPVEDARAEAVGSALDIERQIGVVPRAFAYPSGGQDAAVAAVLQEAGFRLAFTTERGVNDLRRPSWLQLRRINVGARATVPLIRAQLLPTAHVGAMAVRRMRRTLTG